MKESDIRVGQRVRFRSSDQSLDYRKWKYGVVSGDVAYGGQRGPLVFSGTAGKKVVVDTGETHPSGAPDYHLVPLHMTFLVAA